MLIIRLTDLTYDVRMDVTNNKGHNMKTLPYPQQIIIDRIKEKGEVRDSEVGINFTRFALNALIKKGMVRKEERSRLREDDREMAYWDVYVTTNKLSEVLK